MNKSEEAMWNILKEPAPIIDKFGTKRWYNKAGELHRENDQPAIIWKNRTKLWFINGAMHRDGDQPAIMLADGYKAWYINGEFIRREESND